MRQADPLIEEEVLNQRKQRQQIIQEEYTEQLANILKKIKAN